MHCTELGVAKELPSSLAMDLQSYCLQSKYFQLIMSTYWIVLWNTTTILLSGVSLSITPVQNCFALTSVGQQFSVCGATSIQILTLTNTSTQTSLHRYRNIHMYTFITCNPTHRYFHKHTQSRHYHHESRYWLQRRKFISDLMCFVWKLPPPDIFTMLSIITSISVITSAIQNPGVGLKCCVVFFSISFFASLNFPNF